MSLSGNFEELPAERRQQILSACIHEFAQHGYRGASTERMAEAAGISKGLLFYHFKNKKNLYLYIVSYAAKTMIEKLSSKRSEIKGDFFDKLMRTGFLKLRLGWEEPELYKIIFESYTQTPADVKEELRQQYDTTFVNTREHYYRELDPALLKEGVDPKMAVNAMMLLIEGMYYRKLPQFQQMSAEEVLKEVEKMQEEGIEYIRLLKYGICK